MLLNSEGNFLKGNRDPLMHLSVKQRLIKNNNTKANEDRFQKRFKIPQKLTGNKDYNITIINNFVKYYSKGLHTTHWIHFVVKILQLCYSIHFYFLKLKNQSLSKHIITHVFFSVLCYINPLMVYYLKGESYRYYITVFIWCQVPTWMTNRTNLQTYYYKHTWKPYTSEFTR